MIPTGNPARPEKTNLRFGTSGVRGVIGRELTPAFFHRAGSAIGTCLPAGSDVCIATDTRTSRDVVKKAIICGLMESGVNVTDLGILPTPALACLTRHMGFAAGVMVTASHNPAEFNGIKLFGADSQGYTRDREISIEEVFAADRSPSGRPGKLIEESQAGETYLRLMLDRFDGAKLNNKIKLVIDPGNGAACVLAVELFRRAGFAAFDINNSPDGTFPNRSPEPTAESLAGTASFLQQCGADLAVCFDGDADRLVFCDKQGFLGFNEPIAFISRLVFNNNRKTARKLAATVEAGWAVDLALKDLGVEVVRGRVGDACVAQLTKELGAPIGVEEAGVYVFPEVGYYPETFFAALTLLGGLGDVGEIRGLFDKLPPLFLKKTKVACPGVLKEAVMQRLSQNISSFGSGYVNTTDGLRFEYDDGWLLIRPSGTEPVVRASAEATSPAIAGDRLRRAVGTIKDIIGKLSV